MAEQTKEQLEQEVQDLRDEVLFLRKLLMKMAENNIQIPGPQGPPGPPGLSPSIHPLPYVPPLQIGPHTTPNLPPFGGGIQVTCSNGPEERLLSGSMMASSFLG
jgi:hypothetical protein